MPERCSPAFYHGIYVTKVFCTEARAHLGAALRLIPLLDVLSHRGPFAPSQQAAAGMRLPDAVLLEWHELATQAVPYVRTILPLHTPLVVVCTPPTAATALQKGADRVVCHTPEADFVHALVAAHRRHVHVSARPLSTEDEANGAPPLIQLGSLLLDIRGHRLFVGERELKASPHQFDLLCYFAAHAGRLLSRMELLDAVWGCDFDPGTNVVDVAVYKLRRLFKQEHVPDLIETVRGRGYRISTPRQQALRSGKDAPMAARRPSTTCRSSLALTSFPSWTGPYDPKETLPS